MQQRSITGCSIAARAKRCRGRACRQIADVMRQRFNRCCKRRHTSTLSRVRSQPCTSSWTGWRGWCLAMVGDLPDGRWCWQRVPSSADAFFVERRAKRGAVLANARRPLWETNFARSTCRWRGSRQGRHPGWTGARLTGRGLSSSLPMTRPGRFRRCRAAACCRSCSARLPAPTLARMISFVAGSTDPRCSAARSQARGHDIARQSRIRFTALAIVTGTRFSWNLKGSTIRSSIPMAFRRRCRLMFKRR